MRKVILVFAIVCGLVMLSGNAQAAVQWYKCTVNITGVNTTVEDVIYVNVILVEGSGWSGARWFTATGSMAKSALATALTAQSNGSQVYLSLDSDNLTEWGPMWGIFIVSQ